MEIKEIAIGGIDRHTPTQDAPNGVCEELINVRPGATGLEVYGEGTAISGDLNLEDIHIHRWGGKTYYIGINPSGNVVWFGLDGTTKQTLQWVSSAGNVDIKSIGNMLIVSDKGADGKNPSTKTYVLEENDGETSYKALDKDIILPRMDRKDMYLKPASETEAYRQAVTDYAPEPSEEIYTPARSVYPFIHFVDETNTDWSVFEESLKATLKGVINRFMELDEHLASGIVLLGTSVTLYDGTETAFGNLMMVDLSSPSPYRDSGNLPQVWQIHTSAGADDVTTLKHLRFVPEKDSLDGLFVPTEYFLSRWGASEGKLYLGLLPDSGDLGGTAATSCWFHTLRPKITLPEGYENLKDYIKSVNLWVSKPYDKIDWETFRVKQRGYDFTAGSAYDFRAKEAGETVRAYLLAGAYYSASPCMYAKIRRPSECKDGLHKQLLFKQKEWTIDEILEAGGSVDWECEFGSSEGTLGDTLTVDAWNSKRAGTMFIYNNRVHMFDSVVKIDVPDSDLQGLSAYEDEWYDRQAAAAQVTGTIWHVKLADSYEDRANMRDVTIKELCGIRSRTGKVVGMYYSSSLTPSSDPASYTWYSFTPNSKRYVLKLQSVGIYPELTRYVFLSEDRESTTTDTGRAKYMCLHDRDHAGSHPENLSWYGLPAEDYSYDSLRLYRLCNVIAYLKQDGSQLVIRHNDIPVLFRYTLSGSGAVTMGNVANLSGFLTYPDTRCERLVIQYTESGVTYTWETAMRKEDSSYNFAYTYVSEGSAEFSVGSANTDQTSNVYEEKDTVVVSALNNPTVFPVEQSYRFVGEVTGMALALEELNSTQTGSYPVYVMTERGVFALNQGTGGVLYASITPINTDNCVKGKSVQVHRGVVYVANGRIYWLIGRNRTDILLPLDGYPDKAPRGNSSYALACKGTLYNVENLLSVGYIEDYLEGSVLGYDSFHDELLVSNHAFGYTYIFAFGVKRWFKTGGSFGSMDDHHILTKKSGTSTIKILDMTSEKRTGDVLVHIQTRPMKLTPMAFGVIQRMIARVRATLSSTQNLSVYVFTSDNLEDYRCSAAEQRSNATIDRIRLERTAHGRKYTVLVIGGIVPHDTELSTILCQVKANAPKKIR